MTRYTDPMPGPITFDDARAIAASLLGATWDRPGTFHVAEWGRGDDAAWLVIVGAREAIVGGDYTYTVADDAAYLVDRTTGRLTREHAIRIADRIENMRPVGRAPDD